MKLTTTLSFHRLFLALMGTLILLISACDDDDVSIPQEYDPAIHIYGMSMAPNFEAEEALIDPATGAFRLLEGTKEALGGLDLPIGPRFLTDFVNNRRIYQLGGNNGIILQDLETLEKTTIDIDSLQTSINAWDFLTFGPDNNTIYGFDFADDRIFALDLIAQKISVIAEGLPNYGANLEAFDYLPATNELIFLTSDGYLIYSLENQITALSGAFDKELFGFVRHPDTDRIYALTLPSDEQIFRLVQLIRTDTRLESSDLSTADLAIDNLSPRLQTIHTATNTYICKGGSSNFDNPETILYSIDLNTGELLHDVVLNGFGVMLKLRGE